MLAHTLRILGLVTKKPTGLNYKIFWRTPELSNLIGGMLHLLTKQLKYYRCNGFHLEQVSEINFDEVGFSSAKILIR